MPNRKYLFYTGDDITFRGSFRIDGDAQTPDAGTCKATIYREGTDDAIVSDVAGSIAGTQLQYQYANVTAGRYSLFLTAKYNSGADERTGVIEFIVKDKRAN